MNNNHYVYWLGQDGNIWVNQNGNTRNIGKPVNDNWTKGYAEGSNFSMGGQGTLINDPNPIPNNQENDVNTEADYNPYAYGSSSGSGYGSYSTAQAEADAREARARQGYTDAINRTNNALSDLEGSLKNRLDQIEGDYKTFRNEQESTYNKQKNSYDNSSRQNLGNLVTNRNNITNNASRGLRGLQRILGAMGAGGGSVALYDVPSMVKSQADQQYSGAAQTFSQNQSNLDTDWGNYVNDYENDKKKLEDWRTGQIKTAKQENEQKRIDLLNQLSQSYMDRAQVGGALDGDYNSITDRINQANQTIRDLGTYTTPQYNGITAVYKSPELSSYDTGKMNLTTSIGDNNTSGQSLLTVLQNLRKKQENNGLGA